MNVIACVDEKMGMLFNHCRQSRDKEVLARVWALSKNSRLWINDFSKTLFLTKEGEEIICDPDFLQKAGADEFCFVENVDVTPLTSKVNRLYLFKWNCHYPSDYWFTLDYRKWKLVEVSEFPESSHEKITLEVYEK